MHVPFSHNRHYIKVDHLIFLAYFLFCDFFMISSFTDIEICNILPFPIKILGIYEPHYEKICLCHMQTTKAQISLRVRAV